MRSRSPWVVIACIAVASSAIASVWLPVIQHYWIPLPSVPLGLVTTLRSLPAQAVLDEVADFDYGVPTVPKDPSAIAELGRRLLNGQIELPNLTGVTYGKEFRASDIAKGNASAQLQYASLVVPRLLLAAYVNSRRPEFLAAARDFIAAWAESEFSTWLPSGHLWNDHAVAARAVSLAEFWRHYRAQTDFDPEFARVFLRLVMRTGRLLADQTHYTFATNHGVMQNLALLHLAVAFPALPDAPNWRAVGRKRLAGQLAFFVSSEGVVLEHSTEYHRFGVQLFGMAMRYLTLFGDSIPADWAEKYERTLRYYAMLRRPDGTMPRIGDTGFLDASDSPLTTSVTADRAARLVRNDVWRPGQAAGFYPASGYAVWWDGLEHWPDAQKLAQTVMAWSYFPGHGHKHADELSLHLWAAGTEWLTAVGYWPYVVDGRGDAVSWPGSNAPHLVGEPASVARKSQINAYGRNSEVAAIDLSRIRPDGFAARRQVIRIPPDVWIVIDSFDDAAPRTARTVWLTGENVSVDDKGQEQPIRLTDPHSRFPAAADMDWVSSGHLARRVARGADNPPIGWTSGKRGIVPANAIVTEIPSAGGWIATTLTLRTSGAPRPLQRPQMLHWNGPDRWSIEAEAAGRTIRVRRNDASLTVGSAPAGGDQIMLSLQTSTDAKGAVDQVVSAFRLAAESAPRVYKDYLPYRWRMTYALIALLVAQELAILFLGRVFRNTAVLLRVAAIVCWVALGAWLHWSYFAVAA